MAGMEDRELRQHIHDLYETLGTCLSILFKVEAMADATKLALEFDPVLAKRYAEHFEAEQQTPHALARLQAIEIIRKQAEDVLK